jgi:4-amino-4-deoxy-L-arabinose transferase-like glycosyltransferase
MNRRTVFIIIAGALLIKISLFIFMVFFAPEAKFQPDSFDYLRSAQGLAEHGAFAVLDNGVLKYEILRTPGYPLFLGILHYIFRLPLEGVAFVQVLLTLLVAYITYKAVKEISRRGAFLSAAIVLLSPPVTIFSLQILADTLYLTLLTLFVWIFILYLKTSRLRFTAAAAALLALATYVRPVSFYFGLPAAAFIVYAGLRRSPLKGFLHALVFLTVVYALLGAWQLRNYLHSFGYVFTNIQNDYRTFPKFTSYAQINGFNYFTAAWHCFLSLTTRPGSLKYFHCPELTTVGKIFGYPFVVFWWVGLLAGLTKIKGNLYFQFLIFTISYFVVITVLVVGRSSGERYLVPIIPLIAIISAAGWVRIGEFLSQRKRIGSLQ